jgi:hypothetical protein
MDDNGSSVMDDNESGSKNNDGSGVMDDDGSDSKNDDGSGAMDDDGSGAMDDDGSGSKNNDGSGIMDNDGSSVINDGPGGVNNGKLDRIDEDSKVDNDSNNDDERFRWIKNDKDEEFYGIGLSDAYEDLHNKINPIQSLWPSEVQYIKSLWQL